MYVDYFPLRVGGATRPNLQKCKPLGGLSKTMKRTSFGQFLSVQKTRSCCYIDLLVARWVVELQLRILSLRLPRNTWATAACDAMTSEKAVPKWAFFFRVLFFQGLDKAFTTTLPVTTTFLHFFHFWSEAPDIATWPTIRAFFNPCLGGHRMLTWPGFCTVSIEAIDQSRRLA